MQKNKISINNKNKEIMVKNIVKATIVAVVGLIAGINVFNAQKSETMSDVAMANVEALANNELGPDRPDCESCKDAECVMVVSYPNGASGREILDDYMKKPGWI